MTKKTKTKIDLGAPNALKIAMKDAPVKKPMEFSDTIVRGLQARLRRFDDGSIVGVWNFRSSIGGKPRRISLGDVQAIDGTEARVMALKARDAVSVGKEIISTSTAAKRTRIAAEEAKAKVALQQAADAKHQTTWQQLLFEDEYSDGKISRRCYHTMKWSEKTWGKDATNAVKSLLGPSLDLPASDLEREKLEALFLNKFDNAPHAAARAIAYFRPAAHFFMQRDYGIQPDLFDLVAVHLQPPSKGGFYKKAERLRLLSPEEWVAIWNAAPEGPVGMAMRFLMMTGMRNREACTLKWSDIDLNSEVATLSDKRTKNGDPFRVVLCNTALDILQDALTDQHARGVESQLVFTTTGTSPVKLVDKVKKKIAADSGVADFVFHDFRRSITSGMADAGISDAVCDMMLNHRASQSRSGVKKVYNLSAKMPERRAAIRKWDEITTRWRNGDSAEIVQFG